MKLMINHIIKILTKIQKINNPNQNIFDSSMEEYKKKQMQLKDKLR